MSTNVDANPGDCVVCDRAAGERCKDGVCRECHQSLTLEDCNSGAYVNRLRRDYGLPPLESDL